jgi:hypothetical protein
MYNFERSKGTVKNDIIDTPRTGSALKNDNVKPIIENGKIVKEIPNKVKAHGFPNIIDNYAGYSSKFYFDDGADLYQLGGHITV